MLKKVITYQDFDGNERTEEHYFNLTETELIKLFTSVDGGLDKYLESVMASKSTSRIMEMVDMFIKASYGKKSLDGKRFEKSDEIYREFTETLAYDQFYTELLHNDTAAADFINQVVPAKLARQVSDEMRKKLNDGTATLPLPAAALPDA